MESKSEDKCNEKQTSENSQKRAKSDSHNEKEIENEDEWIGPMPSDQTEPVSKKKKGTQ